MSEFKIRVEGEEDSSAFLKQIYETLGKEGFDITLINNCGEEFALVKNKSKNASVLKNIKLGRCEDLSKEIREQFELSESGIVFIETILEGDILKINYVDSEKIGGITGYLNSKGDFNEVDLEDE